MTVGFSTGSIARDNVRLGMDVAIHGRVRAIELSALREDELDPLLESIDHLKPVLKSRFDYISFHAPSKRVRLSEYQFVEKLQKVAREGWAIIVHPDIVEDCALWRTLGSAVCIENMDKRKRIGRTASQLREIFEELPEATLCFDVGHAHQVDSTMQEAEAILRSFQHRLRQVHMSYVNSRSQHERMNFESIRAFRRIAHFFNKSTPIILETPVSSHEVDDELSAVESVMAGANGSDT